jgi:hypothetical protein
LPTCTFREAPLRDLPVEIDGWLAQTERPEQPATA